MRCNIETDRLILRNLVPEDYEAAFKWCGDPEVNEYMIYPLYHNAEDVKTWIETLNPDDPDDYDMGIVLKETGELIGSGGLVYRPEKDAWLIGYNIRKDCWGHGYVVEAMQGIIDHIQYPAETGKSIQIDQTIAVMRVHPDGRSIDQHIRIVMAGDIFIIIRSAP